MIGKPAALGMLTVLAGLCSGPASAGVLLASTSGRLDNSFFQDTYLGFNGSLGKTYQTILTTSRPTDGGYLEFQADLNASFGSGGGEDLYGINFFGSQSPIASDHVALTETLIPQILLLPENTYRFSNFTAHAFFHDQTSFEPFTYALSVYGPDAAVPEPGTWALSVLGVGLAGWALRHRRARTTPLPLRLLGLQARRPAHGANPQRR